VAVRATRASRKSDRRGDGLVGACGLSIRHISRGIDGVSRPSGRMWKMEHGTEMRKRSALHQIRAGLRAVRADATRRARVDRPYGTIDRPSTIVADIPHFGSLFHLPHSPQTARNAARSSESVTNAQPAAPSRLRCATPRASPHRLRRIVLRTTESRESGPDGTLGALVVQPRARLFELRVLVAQP
jgi:hypothetical protein